jgi:transposase
MLSISTIGLDIAKSVFQVHGVDAAGQVVLRRQLKRRHVLAFWGARSRTLFTQGGCCTRVYRSRPCQRQPSMFPPSFAENWN